MLKENENPEIIWPVELSVKDFEGTWWVAHTKSRNEKALAWQLCRGGTSYFLPMRWKVTHKGSRKLRSLVPLFSGYLFFCGDEADRLNALKTNRIANILEVCDPERLVSDLYSIEQILRSGANPEPYDNLEEGKHCRVTSGPFAGVEGVLVQKLSQARLVVQVEMLGQGAALEVDRDIIEVLETSDSR